MNFDVLCFLLRATFVLLILEPPTPALCCFSLEELLLPDGGEEPSRDGEEMKEIKNSLLNVGGVVGIPSLGQIARKFSGK